MCVIFYGPASKILDLDLESAWETNSDGAGIAVRSGRKSWCRSGLMTLESLTRALERVAAHHVVVHLRMATHGAIVPANTHPFPVSRDGWLFHNGIATGFGSGGTGKDSMSDSAHLARVLGRLDVPDRWAVLRNVGGKFAFVGRDGSLTTLGEFDETSKGSGVYESNHYWKFSYYKGKRGTGTYAAGYGWNWDDSRDKGTDRVVSSRPALTTTPTYKRSPYLDRATGEINAAIVGEESRNAQRARQLLLEGSVETFDDRDDDTMICS